MRRDAEKFRAKGAEIVCVAMGDVEDRAAFLEANGPYPFPIYSDPSRDAYVAWGLARGTLGQIIFNPTIIAAGLAAFQEGHRTKAIVGDPFQLAGTFIIDTGGIVRFSHPGKQSSDFPPNDAVLAAVVRTG